MAPPNNMPQLNRREQELAVLLAYGCTLREAAKSMRVAYKTADAYRTNLYRKAHVRNAPEFVVWAVRAGIIEP